VTYEQGAKAAASLGASFFCEVSAKTGKGVELMFYKIASYAIQRQRDTLGLS